MSTKRQLIVLAVGIAVITLVLTLVQRAVPDRPTLDSWTATPEPVVGEDLRAAERTCRDVLDFFGSDQEGAAIADRRGDWTFVALDTPGRQRTCLMTENVVGSRHPIFRAMIGGFAGGWSTSATPTPTLPADGFEALPPTEAETNSGQISYVTGWVGSDVTEVQLSDKAGPDIEATVDEGRFVLWFPASESPGGGPDDSFLTYTLTAALASTTHGSTAPTTSRDAHLLAVRTTERDRSSVSGVTPSLQEHP